MKLWWLEEFEDEVVVVRRVCYGGDRGWESLLEVVEEVWWWLEVVMVVEMVVRVGGKGSYVREEKEERNCFFLFCDFCGKNDWWKKIHWPFDQFID
jgi:hypothetical protein